MKKRILSVLLCLCMVMALLPTTAFAEGTTEVGIYLRTLIADAPDNNTITSSHFLSIPQDQLQAMGLVNSSNNSCAGYYYKDGYGYWIDYCTFSSTKAATYSETKKERGSQEVQDVVDEIKSNGVTPKGGISFNIRPSENTISPGVTWDTLSWSENTNGIDSWHLNGELRFYKITLDLNFEGADNSADSLTRYEVVGTSINSGLPANPTRVGYTFDGWYTSAAGGDPITVIPQLDSDVTYYAHWTLTPATTPTLSTVSGLSLTYGYPAGNSISVAVTNSDANHTYTYQWYSNTSDSNSDGTLIDGATGSTYTIPIGKSAGTTYYYCVVTAKRTDNNQTATATSNAAKLEVGKLTINVTAQNKSSRVGQDLVPLTYTYTPELIGSDAFTGALATDANNGTAGNYTITQDTLALSDNYTLVFTGATYSVVTKDMQDNFKFAQATQTKIYGDADFTVAATGAETGSTVTYTSGNTDVATVDSSGKVQVLKAGTTTITATASETATHAQATASYTLTVNKKGVAEPTVSGTYTYNGAEQTVTLAGFDESCMSVSGNTATNAGNHTVTVTLDGNHQWAAGSDGSITWTINKATPTGTPTYTPITAGGKTLGDAALTVGAITPGGGTITWDLGNTQTVAANTAYNWTYTPAVANQANYNTLTGSITPYVVSYSGGGSSSSTPSNPIVDDTPKGADGSVSFSTGSAKKDDIVTITVTPDRYYKVDGVVVKDKNGNEIAVTVNEDGTFTFQMPASQVTVEPVFSWDNPFTDVAEDTYYAPAVEWALKNDVTNGTGDGTTFSPDDGCTRAQIVTFLWQAAGCPEPAGTNGFTDVSADAYYAKAVAWAVEQGITDGTGGGKFSPDAICTRSQGVTFLYRAADFPEVSGNIAFSDVAAGSYYADAVAWAARNGVTNGTGDGKFSPGSDCTRAQIMTFLYRWLVK